MRKSALLRCTCLIALLVALLFQAAQAQGLDLEKTGSIALNLKMRTENRFRAASSGCFRWARPWCATTT